MTACPDEEALRCISERTSALWLETNWIHHGGYHVVVYVYYSIVVVRMTTVVPEHAI